MTTVFKSSMGDDNIIKAAETEVDTFLSSVQTNVGMSTTFIPFIVMPGDDVTAPIKSYLSVVKKPMDISIGRGLIQSSSGIVVNMGGELKYRHPNYFWVEPTSAINGCGGSDHNTRYMPCMHDQVVGIVEDKGVDHYRVNINSINPVFCSRLGFEGATKRNKPELRKGSVIYGKLTSVDYKNSEMEMTCKVVGSVGMQKDWSTGESIYGELVGGHVIHCSVACARYLLTPDCVALHVLAKHIAFEIVIGLNGVVWIHTGPVSATSILNTILIRNVILNTEYLLLEDSTSTSIPLNAQLEAMIQKLIAGGKQLI